MQLQSINAFIWKAGINMQQWLDLIDSMILEILSNLHDSEFVIQV